MHNFVDSNYTCPFCLLRDGVTNEYVESRASDVVYSDDTVMAFIGSWQFLGTSNVGSTLVIPKVHFEHIFDLPDLVAHRLAEVTKIIATAMRAAYSCDGITLWQNNGPAAHQTVFHYHTHVFPRTKNDTFLTNCGLLKEKFRFAREEIRLQYSQMLGEEIKKLIRQ
jgi:histidine triad (HIT) family protein